MKMKNEFSKFRAASVFFFAFTAFCIFSCGQTDRQDTYNPVQTNVAGEFTGIIVPPGSGFRNLVIIDKQTKRVVFDMPELTQNRLVMLPKGNYELRADGVKASLFNFQDDCKISSDGKTFRQEALKAPPALAFRSGQRENITGPLVEDFSYYLTILDMANLDEKIPVSVYSAVVTGNGINKDIPLNGIRENGRIISEQPNIFKRGSYQVTVSVNGDTKKIPPLRFNVNPKPPFNLTVTNLWNGEPLQYADVQCYISNAALKPVLSRREFDTFVYANENNLIRINDERIVSTGSDGRLVISSIHDNDRIIFLLRGINADDDVYTQTITASDSRKQIAVSWTNVPSKGVAFLVQAGIEANSLDSWLNTGKDISVSMFYRVGRPATIPYRTVLQGNGFKELAAKYRRDSDNTIECFVDLSGISKASHFNYLIRVEAGNEGVFIMDNTADEISKSPQLRKEY
jgi:hypothetical protein